MSTRRMRKLRGPYQIRCATSTLNARPSSPACTETRLLVQMTTTHPTQAQCRFCPPEKEAETDVDGPDTPGANSCSFWRRGYDDSSRRYDSDGRRPGSLVRVGIGRTSH